MKLTLEEGLIYDDKEEIVAEVDEASKSVLFDIPITKELAAAVEKLTGAGYEHVEPIPEPKAKAKKKTAAKKKAAADVPPSYPHPNPGFKDPDYVEWLHDNYPGKFKSNYGVRDEVELGNKDDHRLTPEKDNRYPARRTTVLTKKAHP